jgi:hypothetical protein
MGIITNRAVSWIKINPEQALQTEMRTIDIRNKLCNTAFNAGNRPCPNSAILIEEEVVPKMDSSMKRSAVASLLALR